MTDELVLVAGSRRISGWHAVQVSRGIERMPGVFQIEAAERYASDVLIVNPGDPCQVLLGDDLVITGYVDRVAPGISGRDHRIRIVGRGKCADLVDCSAEWPGMQINGQTAAGIAQRLAAAYGIKVSGAAGLGIPQMILRYGESAWDVIEEVCRYSALLAIEDARGNLMLTNTGSGRAASGFVQGKNVEQAETCFSMDRRFSEYWGVLMSTDLFTDAGTGDFAIAKVTDAGCTRHRRKAIVAEAAGGGMGVAQQRIVWERNRRIARSSAVTLTCDSWRDAAGALWEPNTIASVDLPALKLPAAEWLIGDVTYERDDRGSRAQLTLMPANAFLPEPYFPFPILRGVPPGP
ncbi:MAG: hypothetical protein HY749_15895 [Gammaproteobacteria bacterium]|nr:hypothetical protein [Gammaproteobacteria bacterium]